MRLAIPTPAPCEECGSGAIFHRFTYISIAIDETLQSIFTPGGPSKTLNRLVDRLERPLTPHLLDFLMNIGWAKRVTKPDDDTQLLALMIWREADKRGIKVSEFRLFDLPRNIFVAEYSNGKKIAYEGLPLPPSVVERVVWMDNKAELKKRFRKLGLPVAKGGSAMTLTGARSIFKSLTPPAIAKPFSGSGSRHTVLHITNDEELESAFRIATQVAPVAVIEEELVGPVYRATVVDGKFAAAIRRDQPHVIGDGVHTITELTTEANKNPQRHGPYFQQMHLDATAAKELSWQRFDFDTVLPQGKWAYLHQKINWSVGGTTADVTDDVHPDNVVLFERVAEVLKAPIVGLDFIIADIGKSWKEQERCGILECNSMPFFDNHHLPFEGKPRDVAKLIWDMVLRSDSENKENSAVQGARLK